MYVVVALRLAWRLTSEWRALFDDEWTARDRDTCTQVGFLLLSPPLVWLHEWAHATAMRAFGATDPTIHFFLYWGFVTSSARFLPAERYVVFLAGPLTSYLLGAILLAVALLVPLPRAVALMLAVAGIWQLLTVLVWYPGLSATADWGDFAVIYDPAYVVAPPIVGAIHLISIAAFGWLGTRLWLRGFLSFPVARPWRQRWVEAPPADGGPPAT